MPRNSAKLTWPLLGLTAALLGHLLGQGAAPALAHGAKVEVLQQAVEIVATFETGEPMSDAQVSIYAPDSLDSPWQVGRTDSEGRFLFSPDADADIAEGEWEVTVRKAGHGQTTTFEMGAGASAERSVAARGSALAQGSAAQKWLSMAAILWGFLGTALYFSRKNGKAQSDKTQRVSIALEDSEQEARQETKETVAMGAGRDRPSTPEEYR